MIKTHSPNTPILGLCAAFLAALAGCGSGETEHPSQPAELLAPPPSGQGVQFKMTTSLPPGTEAEHCMFVKAPAEGMNVSRDEVRFTTGSHHVLMYQTAYDEIPTKKEDGTVVDTSGVFDCSNGPTNGWKVQKLISGSQNANGDAFLKFPEGIAMKVRPGAVLMLNVHYVNASTSPLSPEVRVNLYSIPDSQLKTEGDVLFLYHPFIHIPPLSSTQARMRCKVHKDITIQNAQSHMHARGAGYRAQVGNQEPFYTNTHWEDVPVKDVGGLFVPAGEWLDYTCEYKNNEARDIYQGPKSTDEMCMLIGSYYPADTATANCLELPDVPPEQNVVGGEWVGAGKASCAETFGCVQASLAQSFEAMMACVAASDPSVSPEMSAALRCMFKSFGNGSDPAANCMTEFAACQAK